MRELKYKFWDREEKCMIGPNLDSERYYIGSYNGLALFDTERKDEDGYTYQMDVEFLQYTGLKDHNGKEIYEGDIVENSFSQRDDFCYKVIWYEEMGQWMFDPFMKGDYDAPLLGIEEFLKTWEDVGFEDETLEVIGNIYENPSLLEDTP